jgi:hypothetical protein
MAVHGWSFSRFTNNLFYRNSFNFFLSLNEIFFLHTHTYPRWPLLFFKMMRTSCVTSTLGTAYNPAILVQPYVQYL